MIEYNDENCEKLAQYVVDSMDMDAVLDFVREELYNRYMDKDTGEECFREDVEYSGFGEDEGEESEDEDEDKEEEEDDKEKYVIMSESERGFWSNKNGWGDFIDATRFEEVGQLPMFGEWIKVKDVPFDARCWGWDKEDEDE